MRRNRSMGGRFVGKQNMDPNEDKVTPRENNSQTLTTNIRHSVGITPTNILPNHTMIQIQNMPVMSSTIQHSAAPVVSASPGLH